jgi:hypothetical protein
MWYACSGGSRDGVSAVDDPHSGKQPSIAKGNRPMSVKHPECPLYNPLNCKEYYNPKICAFVRRDKACLKKKKPKTKETAKE